MAHKRFSIRNFFKNPFRKPETPLPDNENVDLLVDKAIREINNIIRNYAFGLVHTGTFVARYLDIRIASDMKELLIANITFKKPFYEQDENGKFTYPPTENPQKNFVVTTTRDLTLTGEKREEYLKKLWLMLQVANFTVCDHFKQLKDSDFLFTYTNLGEMEDHSPDMMMFSDF